MPRFVYALVPTTIAILIGLLATFDSAQAAPTKRSSIAAQDETCATDKDDKNENPIRLSKRFGKYRGRCINTELFRKPSVLSERSKSVLVTNVRHDERFWTGNFPTADSEIAGYEFLVRHEGFIVTSGHTQMLVTFKKPVKLRAQDGSGKTASVRNFIYSVEATFPKGAKYNVFKGLEPNYLLIGRLLTAKQSIEEEKESHYDRYPLRLGYQERGQLWKLILEQATSDRFIPYNTFKRNCTSALVNIADKLPRFKDFQLGFKASVSLDPIVGHGVKSLNKRGLLEKRMKTCGEGIKDCRFSIERLEILD